MTTEQRAFIDNFIHRAENYRTNFNDVSNQYTSLQNQHHATAQELHDAQ